MALHGSAHPPAARGDPAHREGSVLRGARAQADRQEHHLFAICRALTSEGRYAAVDFSCETAEPAGGDYERAERLVLDALRTEAENLPPDCRPALPWPAAEPGRALRVALSAWAAQCPRPLVLVFDEIDALRGDSLKSILRQLRDLHRSRPNPCPHSIILCGLRDVRDYKAASGGDPTRLGTASPFNVKVESVRIGDFDEREVRTLLAQHTEDTVQPFTPEALDRVWALTQGQPWLVNALARETVEEIAVPPPEPVGRDHVDEAKERLILARQTHLDSLASKLHEPVVRRVLEPVLASSHLDLDTTYDDDASYLRDLGLIAKDRPVRIANPIYREVIARVLASRSAYCSLQSPSPPFSCQAQPWVTLHRDLPRVWQGGRSGSSGGIVGSTSVSSATGSVASGSSGTGSGAGSEVGSGAGSGSGVAGGVGLPQAVMPISNNINGSLFIGSPSDGPRRGTFAVGSKEVPVSPHG